MASRYLHRGVVLYVALSKYGKWVVAYDGPCGDQNVLAAQGLTPTATQAEAQAQLDAFAAANGLEEWRR